MLSWKDLYKVTLSRIILLIVAVIVSKANRSTVTHFSSLNSFVCVCVCVCSSSSSSSSSSRSNNMECLVGCLFICCFLLPFVSLLKMLSLYLWSSITPTTSLWHTGLTGADWTPTHWQMIQALMCPCWMMKLFTDQSLWLRHVLFTTILCSCGKDLECFSCHRAQVQWSRENFSKKRTFGSASCQLIDLADWYQKNLVKSKWTGNIMIKFVWYRQVSVWCVFAKLDLHFW